MDLVRPGAGQSASDGGAIDRCGEDLEHHLGFRVRKAEVKFVGPLPAVERSAVTVGVPTASSAEGLGHVVIGPFDL